MDCSDVFFPIFFNFRKKYIYTKNPTGYKFTDQVSLKLTSRKKINKMVREKRLKMKIYSVLACHLKQFSQRSKKMNSLLLFLVECWLPDMQAFSTRNKFTDTTAGLGEIERRLNIRSHLTQTSATRYLMTIGRAEGGAVMGWESACVPGRTSDGWTLLIYSCYECIAHSVA